MRLLQELRHFECRGCALTKINKDVYKHLPNLAFLDIGENHLTAIHSDDLRHLSNLKQLKLDGNQIAMLQDNLFEGQTVLRRLTVGKNLLKQIGGNAFLGLYNLTELDLSYNRLSKVREGTLAILGSSLEVLDLSGNALKEHSLKELAGMEVLKELRLAECGLNSLELPLPDCLEVLDVSSNHISFLQPSWPFGLRSLDLSHNLLKGIDEYNMGRLDGVKELRLQGNPWSCDLCHVVPLLDRTNRSATFSELTCASPFTVKGKTLGMLEKSELAWCTASYSSDADFFLVTTDGNIGIIAAGASVCLLFLTVLAILAALCYSKRHAARYYTHEDKLEEGENIFDHQSPLFCDGELNFKFPLDGEKKICISTIEEVKKTTLSNGT